MLFGTPALIGLGYAASSSHRRGAADAPWAIRRALHSPASNGWSELGIDVLGPNGLEDDGDVPLPPTAGARTLIEGRITALLDHGARPIVLGGDHSITYGVLRAIGPRVPNLCIVQIDAHPDLY